MGNAASIIKEARHVPALKALYESKVAEDASDEELLNAIKTFIESDMHCYRQGKRREGKKSHHLLPEQIDEEMQARKKSAEEDSDHEHHEAPHPTQVKPCDDGYVITCGKDEPMHVPGIGVVEECINMSGAYHEVQSDFNLMQFTKDQAKKRNTLRSLSYHTYTSYFLKLTKGGGF